MSTPVRPFGLRGIVRDADPLDSIWHMKVSDRVYGPYTGHDMVRFQGEGRLAATSLVMRDGAIGRDAEWHTALTDGVLGGIFKTPAQPTPSFGKRAETAEGKFVVIMDIKGRRDPSLDQAISALGRAVKIAGSTWLVSGCHTSVGIRNHLSSFLAANDWMLVIDAQAARTAAFNMGPEFDTKLRYVWPVRGERAEA